MWFGGVVLRATIVIGLVSPGVELCIVRAGCGAPPGFGALPTLLVITLSVLA